jgi:hypothetical protein
LVGGAEAALLLPVAMERGQLLLLGEGFLEGGGAAGAGVVGDEDLFMDPEAADAPSGVGHLFDAEGFDVVLGLIVLEEGFENLLKGFVFLGGEAGGGGGEAERKRVEDGLVFGALGLSAIAAGGFDLCGRGVARHRCSLDFKVTLAQVGLSRVEELNYCGLSELGADFLAGRRVNAWTLRGGPFRPAGGTTVVGQADKDEPNGPTYWLLVSSLNTVGATVRAAVILLTR